MPMQSTQSHVSHVVESLPSWSNSIKYSHTKLKVNMYLTLIKEISMLKLKAPSYNEKLSIYRWDSWPLG